MSIKIFSHNEPVTRAQAAAGKYKKRKWEALVLIERSSRGGCGVPASRRRGTAEARAAAAPRLADTGTAAELPRAEPEF